MNEEIGAQELAVNRRPQKASGLGKGIAGDSTGQRKIIGELNNGQEE
jgi:hypothetical protein